MINNSTFTPNQSLIHRLTNPHISSSIEFETSAFIFTASLVVFINAMITNLQVKLYDILISTTEQSPEQIKYALLSAQVEN